MLLLSGAQDATTILYGAPEAIRTPDPQLRRLLLYPAELRAHGCSLYFFKGVV